MDLTHLRAWHPVALGAFMLALGTGCSNSSVTSASGASASGASGGAAATGSGGDTGVGTASGGKASKGTGGAGSGQVVVAGPSDKIVYPANLQHSPITASVGTWLREIAAKKPGRNPKNFMKAGDAISLGLEYLGCIGAGAPEEDLAAHATLQPTVDFFKTGDIAGKNGFLRQSEATRENLTASDALTDGWLNKEIVAANPTYALVMYGGVDIGNGGTFDPSLFYDSFKATTYGQALWEVTDQLIAQGVIPLLRNMEPRVAGGKLVVQMEMFSGIARGIAQGRQVPFVDFYSQIVQTPEFGLEADGLHINSFVSGGSGAHCVFTDVGLKFGYNIMNLLSLEQLERAKKVVTDKEPSLDATGTALKGSGTAAAPFEVPALPFTDMRGLAAATDKSLTDYAACGGGNEAGGEYVYRFEVTAPVKARATLINRTGSPVMAKLHHFTGTATAGNCQTSDETMIPKTFAAGTHYFVVDSAPTSAAEAEMLFLLTACDAQDTTCN